MEASQPPYCMDCLVPLTVAHVLAECPTWTECRHNHFPRSRFLDPSNTLRLMLTEFPQKRFSAEPILNYLQEINLLEKI